MKIKVSLQASQFSVNDEKIISHLQSKHFGTIMHKKKYDTTFLILSPFEVLYLYDKRSSFECVGFSITSYEEFLSQFDITMNEYLVFADLQQKGYIVKQALKFGASFRIYLRSNKDRNNNNSIEEEKSEEKHASHLVFVYSQKKSITPEELFSIQRVAHSTKKYVILAYVDYELSISYLEQKRWV